MIQSNFYMQQRQSQPLPLVFALNRSLSLRHVSPLPLMLGLQFRHQPCRMLDRVLPVLLRYLVNRNVNFRHLFDLHRIVEQGILNPALRDEATARTWELLDDRWDKHDAKDFANVVAGLSPQGKMLY